MSVGDLKKRSINSRLQSNCVNSQFFFVRKRIKDAVFFHSRRKRRGPPADKILPNGETERGPEQKMLRKSKNFWQSALDIAKIRGIMLSI